MKRYIILLLLVSLAVVCNATPPNLACETVFDRKDLRKDGITLTSAKSTDNYFRCVTAKKDKKLVADIKKLIEKDKEKAYNIVEGYEDGVDHIILNIMNNGLIISVGFWWTDSGYVRMFIQAPLAAFK